MLHLLKGLMSYLPGICMLLLVASLSSKVQNGINERLRMYISQAYNLCRLEISFLLTSSIKKETFIETKMGFVS